jgi:hypothetical protein
MFSLCHCHLRPLLMPPIEPLHVELPPSSSYSPARVLSVLSAPHSSPPVLLFLNTPVICVLTSRRSTYLLTLSLLLSLPLGVDPTGEGILICQSNLVDQEYQAGQHNSSRLSKPQCRSQEAEGRTIVHGSRTNVEGEACDHVVHEDAEVVAEVGACDAESVHGGQDEDVAGDEQSNGQGFRHRAKKERVGRLASEGALIALILLANHHCVVSCRDRMSLWGVWCVLG